MAIGQVIGNLVIRFQGDSSDLEAGGKRAEGALNRVNARAVATGVVLGELAIEVGKAAWAISKQLVEASLEAVDDQSKLAARIGGTLTGVQALTRAADLAGVPFEALSKTMGIFNARLGEVGRQGEGAAFDALEKLGISAQAISDMDVDERVAAIADRIIELGWSTQETADFMKQFGIRNQEMINLIQGGGDAIRDARQEVVDYGIALSDIDGVKIEQANDAMASMGITLQGIATQTAIRLAPILQGIADDFNDAGRSGQGFGETIDWAIGGAIEITGLFLDTVHSTQREFKGLQVVALSVTAHVQEGLYLATAAAQDFFNTLADGYNSFAEFTHLPPIEINYSRQEAALDGARQNAIDTYTALGTAQEELDQLTNGPKPSEELAKWLTDVRAKSDEMAAAAIAAREAMGVGDTNPEDETDADKKAGEAAQKEADAAAAKLEAFRGSLQATEMSENESFARRLEQLDAFLANGQVTQAEYDDMRVSMEREHQDKLNDIAKKAQDFRNRLQTESISRVVDTMGAISGALQAGGEDQFGIVKGLSVAMALLKGYESIMSSYAAGAAIGGPPVGIAFAALAGIQTAAQIAQIMSTTSSSSGTPTVAGGSGGAGGGAAPDVPDATRTLYVQGISPGQMFSGEAMRDLAQQMIDFQKDGGKIILGDS